MLERARLARFYGFSLKEIDSLALSDHIVFLEAANILESQEQILRLDAHAFAHTDKKGRSKIFKRYHKAAHPEKHEKKPLDLKQVQNFLNTNRHKLKK